MLRGISLISNLLVRGKNVPISEEFYFISFRDLAHLIYKMSMNTFRLEIRRKILSIREMRIWNGCCFTRVRTEILVSFKREIDITWIYGAT